MTFGKRRTRVEHGLHVVRKHRAGKPALFYVYAYRGGPQIHTCEGERPTITKDLLDIAAEARRARREDFSNSINSLIEAYRVCPEFKSLEPRTQRDYELELRRISERFGNVPLPVFQDRRMREDVIKWRDEVADRPRSADKRTVMLATLLGYGVQLGRLTINVAAGIPALYASDRSDVIWTDADWQAIQGTVKAGKVEKPIASVELMQMLRLGALTGMRLGDLVTLDWSEVGTNAIVKVTRKKKRRVVVPILPELQALLDELGERTGTVLKNSRGKAWTENGIGTVFQRAKDKAGITVRIHDLRGTFATWLARKGLTDQEIGRIIGWSEKRVADLRTRYINEEHVVTSLIERLSKAG